MKRPSLARRLFAAVASRALVGASGLVHRHIPGEEGRALLGNLEAMRARVEGVTRTVYGEDATPEELRVVSKGDA